MHGLVNRAIEDLAMSLGGQELWARIRLRAELPVASFVSEQDYPDEYTYRLVDAAAEVLGMSPEAVLEAFGEHWVRYTCREGYGEFLSAHGDDVRSFLRNLNAMHARVRMTMPTLRPPSFVVREPEPGRFVIRYRSEREGLAPMVTGLLRGLGPLFDEPVEVRQTAWRGEDGDYDVFELRLTHPAPARGPVMSGSR